MALVKCKECGHKISKSADACPNCGAASKKKSGKLGCGGLIVVLVVVGFFASTFNQVSQTNKQAKITEQETALFNQSKVKVIDQLQSYITQGNYSGANTVLAKYKNVKDPALTKIRREVRGLELADKVKAIPADDVKANYNAYKELVSLAPGNAVYKQKLEQYSAKYERLQQIEEQFSAYDGSHFRLERFVKNNLKDPDSFEHVKTLFADRGDYLYIEMTYRGKNSFNAVVTEIVKAKASIVDGSIIEIID